MAEKITAEKRTEFGKGAARRIRRDHKIPAVVYGHGNDPIHLTLPGHDTMMALKHGGANAVLELDIEGTAQLALAKQVQVDPIKRQIEHIDFVAVKRGEKVTVDVPVVVVGETAPDTLVSIELNTVSLTAAATNIPESIEVDVAGRGVGEGFTAADLTLPSGATLVTDEAALVVNLMAAPSAEALEAELAEAEAGIEREESEEAAQGTGEGDVVPEPLDQGSGESMDSAEKSAQND